MYKFLFVKKGSRRVFGCCSYITSITQEIHRNTGLLRRAIQVETGFFVPVRTAPLGSLADLD